MNRPAELITKQEIIETLIHFCLKIQYSELTSDFSIIAMMALLLGSFGERPAKSKSGCAQKKVAAWISPKKCNVTKCSGIIRGWDGHL